MARIKRKKIEFTEDSLNEFYQEVYNDTHNYKAQVNAFIAKWGTFIKDESNIAMMGKDIVNLMNALARTNDQKIVILKILKDIVFAKKGINDDSSTPKDDGQQITLSEQAKRDLLKLAEDARKSIENSNSKMN